ncbi:UDP-galactopyranose mutase [Baekduia soli]|uniref:UDP-galactopyranose mutase n=1 Tax=Baekduia soli TaxID=496014 RepID=A0A5B8U1M2_9ACTN|nr:UDP-galactopyranose mutase [Baekduia soli]QEC46878.1 UDP-galactopyranose mutase [Baekduia soli]
MAPSLPSRPADVLVVGAGFAGAIMAERIASVLDLRVLVVDRREHIAGNAYDELDEHGIRIHRYGPHLFHANSDKVVAFLSRFTDWWPYEHRVRASVGEQLLPVPINLDTINARYGAGLSEGDVEAWLAAQAEPMSHVRTAEDAVVARMGRAVYEDFFRGYTRKQWGLDPRQLDASVTARIPVRTDRDDRYFTDRFQALPAEGYTAMFARILDHPNIEVRLGTEYAEAAAHAGHRHLVYTGCIDEFFERRFGALPYRSLTFDLRHEPTPGGATVLPVGQVNFPSEDVAHTRVTEFRHFQPAEPRAVTALAFEYPSATGDPFYPIPRPANRERYRQYQVLARTRSDVTFVGRLARYQYLNMDQVTGQALATFAERAAVIAASARRPVARAA